MRIISNYIGDLLLRQDSVVVPDLGGFVTRQMPARFSEKRDRLLAPYKQLLFHSNLNLSDGVFERYVANRAQISVDEATLTIKSTVSEWHALLKQGERIEIERVGLLFLDEAHKLRFEQDRHHNLLLQSFGLGDLVFDIEEETISADNKKSHIEVQQEKTREPEPTTLIVPMLGQAVEKLEVESEKVVLAQDVVSSSNSNRSIWLKVAAAAVVLPFLFYSFWVPLTTDVLQTKKIAVADFNPFHKTVQPRYEVSSLTILTTEDTQQTNLESIVEALPEDVNSFNFTYDEDLVFAVNLVKELPENQVQPEAINSNIAQFNSVHLISGCFGLKENADNHMKTLRGMGLNPYIVDVQGGLHRVAASGSNDAAQASKIASELKEQGIDTWTLKK